MTRDDLRDAGDDVVTLIVAQGEKRLAGQCSFAEVQDTRGAALISASVALAAAAAALAAAGVQLTGGMSRVAWAGAVATVGFSASAFLALWSTRACNFHSAGWYPNDFADDVSAKRSVAEMTIDFAFDLQHRLSENRTALVRRGNLYNAATITLLGTPLAALMAALMTG